MAPTAVTRMINLTVIKYVSHLLGSRWFDFAAFVHLSPLLAPVLLLFPLHNSHTHRGGGEGGGEGMMVVERAGNRQEVWHLYMNLCIYLQRQRIHRDRDAGAGASSPVLNPATCAYCIMKATTLRGLSATIWLLQLNSHSMCWLNPRPPTDPIPCQSIEMTGIIAHSQPNQIIPIHPSVSQSVRPSVRQSVSRSINGHILNGKSDPNTSGCIRFDRNWSWALIKPIRRPTPK